MRAVKLTWQDSEQDHNDDVEEDDVGNADANGQPAPPVVDWQAKGGQDAVTQSLCCVVGVHLVLPVTCSQQSLLASGLCMLSICSSAQDATGLTSFACSLISRCMCTFEVLRSL